MDIAKQRDLLLKEIKIFKPGDIKTYPEFIKRFNSIFSRYFTDDNILTIEDIDNDLFDLEDGGTIQFIMFSDHDNKFLQPIFDQTFNKYDIYATVKSEQIEYENFKIIFYLDQLN
jgi:hypothetical protein